MSARVRDYLARLKADLDGKTPQRLGDVVFVLTDDSGNKQRFTVSLDEGAARVQSGVHETDDRPSALVRGTFAAWVAFFHDGQAEQMSELGFYGEVALIETLAALLSLKMSPLAMNVGAKDPGDS